MTSKQQTNTAGSRQKGRSEFLVIGLGRFGSNLARRLTQLGYPVLGVDRMRDKVEDIADEIGQAMIFDATYEEALEQIGVADFTTAIIAMAEDFESSALITTSLHSLGAREIIAVAHSDRHRTILLAAGANSVILPLQESGNRLADDLAQTGIVDAIDLAPGLTLAEIPVPASLAGRRVADCENYGVLVLGLVQDNVLLARLTPETVLSSDQLLVVAGDPTSVSSLGSRV